MTVDGRRMVYYWLLDIPGLCDPKQIILYKASFNYVNRLNRGHRNSQVESLPVGVSDEFIRLLHLTYENKDHLSCVWSNNYTKLQ